MFRFNSLSGILLLALFLISCEIPKSPDFTTSQKVEAPILINKTYQFIGEGDNVFIDTTRTELDSLFSIDGDEFITIAKEQNFNFGDLNDAVPEVNIAPVTFDARVGQIELGNFSSATGNLGQASFSDLTGINATVSPGDPVPPQTVSPSVTIDLNTDRFESATIVNGSIVLSITNDLGFNLDNISVTIISSPNGGPDTDVASGGTGFLTDGSQGNVSIDLSGNQVANPQVRVSVSWTSTAGSPQTFQRTPDAIIVNDAVSNQLVASQIVAAISQQDFSSSGVSAFDTQEFLFSQPDHFVQLSSGVLQINNVTNNMNVGLDELTISFPGILASPYSPADSLVISFSGTNAISANSTNQGVSVDLNSYRIFAEGNEVDYNISALTEDTGNNLVTLNENDNVLSEISINNINIDNAFGSIVTQTINLAEDDPANGTDILDIFNDSESQLTEIDGINDLSEQIEGLEFSTPTISINYTTNIGVASTVYGALLGLNSKGEEEYLTGASGSEYELLPGDVINGLNANGAPINRSNLIKFDVVPATDLNTPSNGSIVFDKDNTNVQSFLNKLPDRIRFIGKAVVNEDGTEGFINSPVQFDPIVNIEIPLAFSTSSAATFRDTTDRTSAFEDLPSTDNQDSFLIREGRIIIDYSNGLPLAFDASIYLLDEQMQRIITIPGDGSNLQLGAASVDANSFAVQRFDDRLEISLNESQLNQFYQARFVEFDARLITNNNDEIKLRTTDNIVFSARAELVIENEVN